MFAKTRLALMIGCITGGFSAIVLAQDTTPTKEETVVVTSINAKRRNQAGNAGYR